MKRVAVLLGFALLLLLPTTVAAAGCQFVLGFATIRDLIGHDIVGECLENEHHGANGDTLQQTTGGLLVWRKADNWTAFTDGYRTWINGPNGLVQRLNTEHFAWEADYAPGGSIATPTPTPIPPPTPTPMPPTPTPAFVPPPTPTPIQPPKPSQETIDYVDRALASSPQTQRSSFTIKRLQELAQASRSVFRAVLRQAEDNPIGDRTLGHIITLAQIDEGTALQIVQMPFMRTADQGNDEALLRYAKHLSQVDLLRLQQLLSQLRRQGGVTDDHTSAFVLSYLGRQDPKLATAIRALPWVRDGVRRPQTQGVTSFHEDPGILEESAILKLAKIASRSQEVAFALVRKPWFRDGLGKREFQVVANLSTIVDGDTVSGLQLLSMPFLDTVSTTGIEAAILDALDSVLWYSPNMQRDLQRLLADSLLRGGITDDQRATVELLAVGKRSPEIAAAIDTLPWVRDGLDASEQRSVAVLHEASRGTRQLLPALVRESWVRDSLSLDEQDAIGSLVGISRYSGREDEAAALAILAMPFLDDFDGRADSAAVSSLGGLHYRNQERSYLRQVLSHPTLSGGVTDANRSLVAVLDLVVEKRANLLDALLDIDQTSVEERVIVTPRAGEILLAVIHTRPGQFRTMDILEHTVRSQEDFMLEAFPRKFVALLVADVHEPHGHGGQRGKPTIDPGREEDASLIGHEVGHTFWPSGATWIREGGAIVLELAAQDLLTKASNAPFKHNCHLADNLADLESVEAALLSNEETRSEFYPTGICPYDLGWGIFRDLNRRLGNSAFRNGFRRLYVKLKSNQHQISCVGQERTLCYMKFAFVTDADPKAAAIAEPIINRWYYGSEQGQR